MKLMQSRNDHGKHLTMLREVNEQEAQEEIREWSQVNDERKQARQRSESDAELCCVSISS